MIWTVGGWLVRFDPTITLGTLLSATAIIAGTWASISHLYSLLDKRIALFEEMLKGHAIELSSHAARIENHDIALMRLVGDLQRVIGRIEADSMRRGLP